ncbi:unnamed protein product, partial [Sphagnum tenellum]
GTPVALFQRGTYHNNLDGTSHTAILLGAATLPNGQLGMQVLDAGGGYPVNVHTYPSNIATTAYVLGQAANGGDAATIQMDFGTVGQVGISTHWARNDHVHPTDITRAPILSPELLGSPTIQNTPPTGDNSNLIADTAFVTRAIDNVQLLPGPQGTQGDVGPQGPPGQNGTNGASASPATGFGALYTYAILQSYYNADGGAPVPGTSYPASFFVSGSAYGGGTTIAPSSGNWTCMGCIIATDVSQGGSGSV